MNWKLWGGVLVVAFIAVALYALAKNKTPAGKFLP